MKKQLGALVATAALALLSACASNEYCLKPQKYQGAANLPELRPVDGLQIPESASALRVPPEPENVVPFGEIDENGKAMCLDHPQRLYVVESAPAQPAE